MNAEQEKSLRAFACTANWSCLHTIDEGRWQEFIEEACKAPGEIREGEVYGTLSGLGCPNAMAGVYEYKCRNARRILHLWWRKFVRRMKFCVKSV